MRKAFTMIELIFIIVIIGILAAVAMPKLLSTVNESKKANIVSFVGTLNRSVGPMMWEHAINNPTDPGSVKTIQIASYTDLPIGIENFNLAGCGTPAMPSGTSYKKIADITNLEAPASIYCLDGTKFASPLFAFSKSGSATIVYE